MNLVKKNDANKAMLTPLDILLEGNNGHTYNHMIQSADAPEPVERVGGLKLK